jgi:glutamine synthetase
MAALTHARTALNPDELVGFLYSDLGAVVRGRFVVAAEAQGRMETGLGWVPANQALTCFGTIAEPNRFGSVGDLRLRPDPDSRVRLEGGEGRSPLHFYLCDAVEPDGTPWECCPRAWLRTVLAEFERETGARVRAAFEHEFQLDSAAPSPAPFSLEAMRLADPFPGLLTAALSAAGVEPDAILAEYGAHQFEVPCRPVLGLAAADRSVIVKEVVREVARWLGKRATFTPIAAPGGSANGAHIHVSFVGADGTPLAYGDGPGRLSELAAGFAAGVLRHAPAITALFAPIPLSYRRLTPHQWSAGTAALGERNRETLLRLPTLPGLGGGDPAELQNLEFRGADAAASPYLALGAIVRAGLEGVRERLPCPPLLDRDPETLDAGELHEYAPGPLPTSLGEALDLLEGDPNVGGWMPPVLLDTYVTVKRAELDALEELDEEEVCHRYGTVY